LSVRKATLASPKPRDVSYVENGGGAAGDPAGDWTGSLVGHGSLLAYVSWTECDQAGAGYAHECTPGLPELYHGAMHPNRVGVMQGGSDVLRPVWTDGRAILVRHADDTLVLFDAKGRVAHRFAAVPGLAGAVFEGARLVTLTSTALTVWNARTGARVRSFAL